MTNTYRIALSGGHHATIEMPARLTPRDLDLIFLWVSNYRQAATAPPLPLPVATS